MISKYNKIGSQNRSKSSEISNPIEKPNTKVSKILWSRWDNSRNHEECAEWSNIKTGKNKVTSRGIRFKIELLSELM